MTERKRNGNKKEAERLEQDIGRYQDIIGLPHPVSKKHPQMSLRDRAAQFAPFAALSGHGEIIRQTEKSHVGEDIERVEYEGEI
ncbi:MAG: hypothetical protein HFH12_02960 [Dorea sp.]|nr:hypothetical protein [Dorea sp.]